MATIKQISALGALATLSANDFGNAFPLPPRRPREMTFAILAAEQRVFQKRSKRRNKIKAQRAQNVRRMRREKA